MQAASCYEKTNKQWKGHSAYALCTMHIHNNQTHRLGLFKSNSVEALYKLFLIWCWSWRALMKSFWGQTTAIQTRPTPSVFKVLNGFFADYDQNFYFMDIDQSSLSSPLLLLPPRPPSNKIGVQLYLINHPNCRFALCIFASQTSVHFKLFRFSNWLLLG